ncbi:MAG: glycosyltransferase [Planctomycetota bacterium]
MVLVTRGFPPAGRWGSEGYAHDIAVGLARRGHRVDVFFPLDGVGALRAREVEPGLRVFELPLRPHLGKPLRDSYDDSRQDHSFRELLEREGPYDRVHFTALAGGVSLGLIHVAREKAREVWVTLTEFLPFCHRGQFLDAGIRPCRDGPDPALCSSCITGRGPYGEHSIRAALRSGLIRVLMPFHRILPRLPGPGAFRKREACVAVALSKVDLFLAPSTGLMDRYLELGMARERLEYLPYALEPRRYAGFRREPPGDTIRLTFMAQLAPHKGAHVIVGALELLEPELRQRLRVAAHGAATSHHYPRYAEELIETSRASDLPIDFPGPFPPDEVQSVLARTDLLLLPSLWLENLPLVLLHARACGIPVLASRVAGITPFVQDGEDGLLAEPGDTGAWAKVLARLVREKELLSRLEEGAALAGVPLSFEEHLDVLEGEQGRE